MPFGFYDFIADVCVGAGTEELVDVAALFGMQVMTVSDSYFTFYFPSLFHYFFLLNLHQ